MNKLQLLAKLVGLSSLSLSLSLSLSFSYAPPLSRREHHRGDFRNAWESYLCLAEQTSERSDWKKKGKRVQNGASAAPEKLSRPPAGNGAPPSSLLPTKTPAVLPVIHYSLSSLSLFCLFLGNGILPKSEFKFELQKSQIFEDCQEEPEIAWKLSSFSACITMICTHCCQSEVSSCIGEAPLPFRFLI